MRLTKPVLVGIWLLGLASAQLTVNVAAFGGQWESSLPKHSQTVNFKLEVDGETQTGECAVDVQDSWSLTLTEVDGGLQGFGTDNYFRAPKPIATTAGLLCTQVAQKNFLAVYDVAFSKVGDKFDGVLKLTNCSLGQCPAKSIRATLTMDADKMICVLEGDRKIELSRKDVAR
jgi:hypothetical protein